MLVRAGAGDMGLEHRGPLGVDGKELLRVRSQFEGASEPIETEVPVDEVSLVGSAA